MTSEGSQINGIRMREEDRRMQKETGRVVSQKKIAEDIFDLRIRTSAAKDARPGS